ncbi:alpha/beta hydrolase [Burkholderia sp. WP9]|uniref:alpha/beta hydrolase n=1 Tax=Burkholderia sp. WP9 TaxID=1500263 RepID=UPI00115F888F|nr:alpha/beta hydrolase [Burkholderia sp. WP9]
MLTDEVAERPLVIVPPAPTSSTSSIFQSENSFVRFACEQAQTVFPGSWRNPDADLGHITWDDYLEEGAMKAIGGGRVVSGADMINAVDRCGGGKILSSALAVLRARGDD